ncbi:MAG: glycosyltransferase family 9 protein [Desulforegulaceae bacterium]|nr:glycosyltransferase family 9 protein [Desulforegulaceae bacterium]
MKKALIINTSNLGDVISGIYVSNPLLKAGYEVSYLIKDTFSSLFSDTDYIEYTTKSIPSSFFDLTIDLTSDNGSRKIIKKIKSKNKIGRNKNFFSKIKHSYVYTKQVNKYTKSNHIVYNFKPVLELLNIEPINNTYLNTSINKKPGNEVCIHIGAKSRIRCIPLNLIIDICNFFKSKNIPVRLIGHETDIAEKILEKTNGFPVFKFSSLKNTKKWLYNARLVIASDSGIFHLASALKTKTIGIYGPNTYNRSGSINHNTSYIELDLPCRPCNQNIKCPYDIKCLYNIKFEDVEKVIMQNI